MRMVTGNCLRSVRQQGLVWVLAAGLGFSFVVGCSNKPSPSPGNQASNGESTSESPEAPAAPAKGTKKSRNGQTMVSTSKRPMIGDIPLDVWFPDPVGESKKTGTVAPGPQTTPKPEDTGTAKTTTPKEPPPAEVKPAGGADWASVIPLDDLQEETKVTRLAIQKSLASLQVFKSNFKEIASDAAVLSAIAAIALVHPEKVSWKERAAQVRDVAAELAKKSKEPGQKTFDEVKKEFEKIDGLLSGNPPPGIEEAAADVPFSEVVSRRGIMKRLQKSSDELRAKFQAESTLLKQNEDAAHTATTIAALTKVIGSEGYDDADAEDYQKFVNGLMEANLAMAKAARDKDFAAFSEANGRVTKFCGECHSAYQSTGD